MTDAIPKTPQHDDLRGHLLELYARLISTPAPPDQVIARFFRLRHSMLPQGPRGFLAATTYALLRRRVRTLLLHQWAGRSEPLFAWPEPGAVPPVLTPVEEAAIAMARWLVEDLGAAPDEARALIGSAASRAKERVLPEGEFPMPPVGNPGAAVNDFLTRITPLPPSLSQASAEVQRAAALSLPMDLLARWTARFGDTDADALARSLGETAPLDLRANLLKGTREELAEKLRAAGMESSPTKHSPHGLRLAAKANVFRTDLFQEGWFEVQDEASQIVALALDPKPTWRVLDACSGGGGKSLHLAALMKNRGEVFAHDLDAERLEPQKKRLRRAGVHNVRIVEPGKAAEAGPFDAVLIDAPCLGLGTLRRNPDFAWRGPLAQRLAEMSALQRECLKTYAPLVKPGGVLVYATCSFEPEENELLLAELPSIVPGMQPESLSQALGRYGAADLAGGDASMLTLLPSKHGTDGFFIARWRRIDEF